MIFDPSSGLGVTPPARAGRPRSSLVSVGEASCVPPVCTSGRKPLKTKNFTFFQALRKIVAERKGLSASCLKPRVFNGFELPDFVVCTAACTNVEPCPEFESHLRNSNAWTLIASETTASAGPARCEGDDLPMAK
jgi:hypothetical protein